MSISFGMYSKPSSTVWEDIRKGPSLEAVREHLERVVNFPGDTRLVHEPGLGDP